MRLQTPPIPGLDLSDFDADDADALALVARCLLPDLEQIANRWAERVLEQDPRVPPEMRPWLIETHRAILTKLLLALAKRDLTGGLVEFYSSSRRMVRNRLADHTRFGELGEIFLSSGRAGQLVALEHLGWILSRTQLGNVLDPVRRYNNQLIIAQLAAHNVEVTARFEELLEAAGKHAPSKTAGRDTAKSPQMRRVI